MMEAANCKVHGYRPFGPGAGRVRVRCAHELQVHAIRISERKMLFVKTRARLLKTHPVFEQALFPKAQRLLRNYKRYDGWLPCADAALHGAGPGEERQYRAGMPLAI